MRRGRVVTGITTAIVVALITAVGASAATPRQIYADFADNGRLDGTYSRADLERALLDAEGQGYGQGSGGPARAAIKERLSNQGSSPAGAPVRSGSLPFTGLDLALLTFGAVFLLVLGYGFRRIGRARA